MSEDLDPAVDVVVFIVEVRLKDDDPAIEYDVHGEGEAIALIERSFKEGVSVTVPAPKDDPEEIWDMVSHYPPWRIREAYYLKRNSKPRPSGEEPL